MVSFDSRQPGTPAGVWAAEPRLRGRPALDLDGVTEILVIAAHPDDETLGAGGLIAESVTRGIPVRVVVVTDGDARGEADRRADELQAAMGVLGASATSLGFRDGETREQRELILDALAPIIEASARTALILAPWTGDGHRDHRVVGEIVESLVGERRHLQYPVWLWHWAEPGSDDVPWDRFTGIRVDADLKARALAEYASQTEGDDPVLRADFVENFRRDEELFIEVGGLGRDYFDALYARNDDPWRLGTRWYESRKRAITLASLPEERYATGLEIGCSVGMLTEGLADRVDYLLAVDISQSAVDRARAQVNGRARVERADVLDAFPEGPFDLIVLSEVGYYFGRDGLERVLDGLEGALAPGGTVVACHWRHPVADYPLTGDEVHEALGRRGFAVLADHREDDFLLEVLSRDGRSVAQRGGLA